MSTAQFAYLMTDQGVAIAINVTEVKFVLHEQIEPGYGPFKSRAKITIGYHGMEKVFGYENRDRALRDYKEFIKVVSGLEVGDDRPAKQSATRAIEMIDVEIEEIK